MKISNILTELHQNMPLTLTIFSIFQKGTLIPRLRGIGRPSLLGSFPSTCFNLVFAWECIIGGSVLVVTEPRLHDRDRDMLSRYWCCWACGRSPWLHRPKSSLARGPGVGLLVWQRRSSGADTAQRTCLLMIQFNVNHARLIIVACSPWT